ncbi:hypothetical protein [uncultured Tateyamaria sp.]|uniref:hypothetical protein n=1 Tax=Tateyamaria sp. 1078 TaxID=3417464 RepID=UPI0026213B40|nr:hypothetical protein [uncultured Tateyamaria sp.]
MKLSAYIAAAFIAFGAQNALGAPMEPLTRPTANEPDSQFAFYARCAGLERISRRSNEPSFAGVLGLPPSDAFFAASKNGYFSRRAHHHAFADAGYDWDKLWDEAHDNGGLLPLWVLALTLGIDEVQKRNEGLYRQRLIRAKAGNTEDKAFLLADASTCVEVVNE